MHSTISHERAKVILVQFSMNCLKEFVSIQQETKSSMIKKRLFINAILQLI